MIHHGDPKRNYAREWKRWRKQHKMSRRRFAIAVGLTERTILNIEMGHTRPRLTSRIKFRELQKRYNEAKLGGEPCRQNL